MALLPKIPSPTIEEQVAMNVSEFGLSSALGGYEFLARGYKGKAFSKFFRGIGERGLAILGNPPYAPGPSLETTTAEEARQAEAKRTVRRRGRRRTRITGELEPQTTKRALLG